MAGKRGVYKYTIYPVENGWLLTITYQDKRVRNLTFKKDDGLAMVACVLGELLGKEPEEVLQMEEQVDYG